MRYGNPSIGSVLSQIQAAKPDELVVMPLFPHYASATTGSVSEAVMQLELQDVPALMFRNASHDGLNMVYRRPDGHIGWVDPANTPRN